MKESHKIRISAGIFKNKKLLVPESAKPLRERIKLSVFSIIGNEKIKNAFVLDLFAGSGNLGFEALSRGASMCTFVDNNYEAIGFLRENYNNLKKTNEKLIKNLNIQIAKNEATKFISNDATHYDIIFLDPPYSLPIKHLSGQIHENLKEKGIIIYFRETKSYFNVINSNTHLKIIDIRQYGRTTVDFITRR